MGLFDKKFCDICGDKISLLGNRKLEDGNMCSSCAKLISPLMTDRRRTTIAEMKEHLAYREENKKKLAAFSPSETFGESKKVYIDRAKGCFVISSYSPGNWEKENPDVIPLSEVSSCTLDIKEDRTEEFMEDAQGNQKSYSPPRYTYEYDFYLNISLSSKWFSEAEIKLNNFDVEGLNSQKYHNYEMMGQQIINALTGNQSNFSYGSGYSNGSTFGSQQQYGSAGAGMAGAAAGFVNTFVNEVARNAGAQANSSGYSGGYSQYQQTPQQMNQGMQYQQTPQQMNQGMQYQQAPQQMNQGMQYGTQNGYSGFNAEDEIRRSKEQTLYQLQTAGAPANPPMMCPNCKTATNSNFCPNCGTPAVPAVRIICSRCRFELEMKGIIPKFCPNCGDPIGPEDVIL